MRLLLFISLFFVSSFQFKGHSDAQKSVISHTAWDALLKKHVNSKGQVNYNGFKTDKAKLDAYLSSLSTSGEPAGSKAEKQAYWINAYNAFTVQLILDGGIPSSIQKLKGGKPWDVKFISIKGKKYSLNNIEHDVLRAKYFDPRLHFVLVCAAVSCPKLLNEAYTAANLEDRMTKQTKYFINQSGKNTITANSAQVSQLFNWYKGDFTKSTDLVGYLNKYSSTKLNPKAKISYKTYNWALNKQ